MIEAISFYNDYSDGTLCHVYNNGNAYICDAAIIDGVIKYSSKSGNISDNDLLTAYNMWIDMVNDINDNGYYISHEYNNGYNLVEAVANGHNYKSELLSDIETFGEDDKEIFYIKVSVKSSNVN